MNQDRDLVRKFSQWGQDHLFAYWEQRDESRRRALLTDLGDIDLELLKALQQAREQKQMNPQIDPVAVETLENLDKPEYIRHLGEKALSAGKAGCLLVAGGQGSRLGFSGPKGQFPITPLRQSTLFELFAEKILAARNQYGQPLNWYIMTSPLNHHTTREYFEQNRYFGLPPAEVFFFPQGLLPSLDEDGRLILAKDGGLFKNPDGHGGTLSALKNAGLIEQMKSGGVEDLFYFQVDNPLVNIPDPLFLGVHLHRGSEMSSKVVEKAYPEEKLGNIGKLNGLPGVLEYSDLDNESIYARSEEGKLLFSHGSIAVHILNRSFLECLDEGLPFHQACKRIESFVPTVEGGKILSREAVKFEKFIFDAIPLAKNPLFWETMREEEFAPLKNRTGVDSIETCQAGLTNKYARWLEHCGVTIPRDADGRSRYLIEISPLYAADERTLKKQLGNTVNSINENTLLV